MHFRIPSAICFNLDQSKILSSGNGLNHVNVVNDIYDINDGCHNGAEKKGGYSFLFDMNSILVISFARESGQSKHLKKLR